NARRTGKDSSDAPGFYVRRQEACLASPRSSQPPNPRLQRPRSRAPLSRKPLGGPAFVLAGRVPPLGLDVRGPLCRKLLPVRDVYLNKEGTSCESGVVSPY